MYNLYKKRILKGNKYLKPRGTSAKSVTKAQHFHCTSGDLIFHEDYLFQLLPKKGGGEGGKGGGHGCDV